MVYAELDRFGYTLSVIADTEEKAVNALMTEYEKAYENINGTSPHDEICDYVGGDVTFYDNAKEDIVITGYTKGVVTWK